MKNNFIKRLISLVLVVTCILCITACSDREQTGDNVKTQETNENPGSEEIKETEEQTELGGKSLLGSTSGNGLTYYLKLDGIEGDSKDSKHDKWIEVTEFSHGVSQEVQTGLPVSSNGNIDAVTFVHKIDKATPNLQKYCMNGSMIKNGVFEAVKSIAGKNTAIYTVEFAYIRIINSSVETRLAENGSSYLVEKVSMFVDRETVTAPADKEAYSGYSHKGLTYYLRLDNIEGSSNDSKHASWIDVMSFSHGAVRDVNNGNQPGADTEFEPVVITHKIDNATPKFKDHCLAGTILSSGEIQVMRSTAGFYELCYKISLEKIKIVKTEVKTVTDENGVSYLVEEVSMLVAKESWTVTSAGLDNSIGGSTEANYDQSKKC